MGKNKDVHIKGRIPFSVSKRGQKDVIITLGLYVSGEFTDGVVSSACFSSLLYFRDIGVCFRLRV